MSKKTNAPKAEPQLRPHSFDGIEEFDQRLPNWWLFTLYGSIVFWIACWSFYEWFHEGLDGPQRVEIAMAQIEATKLAATTADKIDDPSLWAMSRNPVFIEQGRQVFEANCVPCHLSSLRGKSENPAAIGPDLTDKLWIHGGRPTDAYRVVTMGVPEKGMPTWGPVLGARRISQAVAYVFSHHQEGEPILPAAGP